MTEKEYRELPYLSYSSLKLFNDNRRKFYKEYVLGEKKPIEATDAMIFGSLVDTLLFSPDEWGDRFYISSAVIGSGQMFEFAEELFKVTLKHTENDEVTTDIKTLMEEALNNVKYDKHGKVVKFKDKELNKVIEMFVNSDAEIYYNSLRQSAGKYVISEYTNSKAEEVAQELKYSDYTREIFDDHLENWESYNQLPIVFKYQGETLKCMVDRLRVNHSDKIIYRYDLKCTSQVEDFGFSYFKFKYYIQNGIYQLGVESWAKENGLEDYKVLPMKFINCDSANYLSPLIWETCEQDVYNAINGFKVGRRFYRGIDELLKDIKFAKENNLWRISRLNHINNGKVKLDIAYECNDDEVDK